MSTQTSLSASLPPAVNRPTTRKESFFPSPSWSVPPTAAPLKRFDRLRLTMHSPLPGSKSRPPAGS